VNLRGASSRILDWALDKVGNRQSETNDGAVGIYSMSATIPPGDFQMCRYTVTPFGSKSYDANGNLVASGSGPDSATFYRYDYADRLVAVQAFSTLGTLDTLASFNYDALGRRISKTTYPPTPLAPVTTQYVKPPPDQDCDGLALEERVAGAVSRVYCWGGNGLDMNWVCFTGGGEAQYAHADDLGNVLALTDVIGNVLERYDYDAAGAPTFLVADGTTLVDGGGLPLTASAQGNPYLFRGMVWDGETGLYIEGTPKTPGRYVDPKTGSYLSSGSVGEAGTELNDVNRRVFAGGNPWSSPAGRSKQSEAKSNTKAMFTAEKAYRSSGSGGGGGGSLVLKKEEGGRHTPFHNKYESARVITDRDSGRSKGFRSSGGNAVGADQVNEIIASVSAIQSRNILKTYFETGDIPTQDQFHNLIDSMVHLNDDGGSLLMISSSKTHTKTGHVTLLK
jgi:YD repeat-containing protein